MTETMDESRAVAFSDTVRELVRTATELGRLQEAHARPRLVVREPPMPKTIAGALVKAQALIRAVGHDAQNSYHRYKYTSAEALLEAARDPMASSGLGLVQMGWTVTEPEVIDALLWVPAVEGKNGKDDLFVPKESKDVYPAHVTVRYLLVHDSGDSWELPPVVCPVIPEAGRPHDKALATALTYSLGYALRGLLKIPRTGDPDRTDSNDDPDQRDDRRTTRNGTKATSPSDAASKREKAAVKIAEALDALPRETEDGTYFGILEWADEYGPRAVAAIGMDRLQPMAVSAGARLKVAEADVLAALAKAAKASKSD